jgi:hypothetical protein
MHAKSSVISEAYFSHCQRNYVEDACNSPYFVLKNAFLVKKQVKSTSEEMLQEKVVSG